MQPIILLHRCLQQYLRAFVHNKPKQWGKYLHWTEWNYNTTEHSATRVTPFQVVYGKPPSSIPTCILNTSNIEAIDTNLSRRKEVFTLLWQNLLKVQKNEKTGSHRTTYEFRLEIGYISSSNPFINNQWFN